MASKSSPQNYVIFVNQLPTSPINGKQPRSIADWLAESLYVVNINPRIISASEILSTYKRRNTRDTSSTSSSNNDEYDSTTEIELLESSSSTKSLKKTTSYHLKSKSLKRIVKVKHRNPERGGIPAWNNNYSIMKKKKSKRTLRIAKFTNPETEDLYILLSSLKSHIEELETSFGLYSSNTVPIRDSKQCGDEKSKDGFQENIWVLILESEQRHNLQQLPELNRLAKVHNFKVHCFTSASSKSNSEKKIMRLVAQIIKNRVNRTSLRLGRSTSKEATESRSRDTSWTTDDDVDDEAEEVGEIHEISGLEELKMKDSHFEMEQQNKLCELQTGSLTTLFSQATFETADENEEIRERPSVELKIKDSLSDNKQHEIQNVNSLTTLFQLNAQQEGFAKKEESFIWESPSTYIVQSGVELKDASDIIKNEYIDLDQEDKEEEDVKKSETYTILPRSDFNLNEVYFNEIHELRHPLQLQRSEVLFLKDDDRAADLNLGQISLSEDNITNILSSLEENSRIIMQESKSQQRETAQQELEMPNSVSDEAISRVFKGLKFKRQSSSTVLVGGKGADTSDEDSEKLYKLDHRERPPQLIEIRKWKDRKRVGRQRDIRYRSQSKPEVNSSDANDEDELFIGWVGYPKVEKPKRSPSLIIRAVNSSRRLLRSLSQSFSTYCMSTLRNIFGRKSRKVGNNSSNSGIKQQKSQTLIEVVPMTTASNTTTPKLPASEICKVEIEEEQSESEEDSLLSSSSETSAVEIPSSEIANFKNTVIK